MKKETWLYLGFICVIMLSFMNFSKLNDLEQRLLDLQNMQSDIHSVHDSIDQISSQVEEKMEEMEKQNAWVQNQEFLVKGMDLKKGTIDLSLHWKLKELPNETTLLFSYRPVNEEKWTQIQVKENQVLSYSIENTFSLHENYEAKIVATSTNGTKSEEFLPLNFQEEISNHLMVDANLQKIDGTVMDVTIDVFNQLQLPLLGEQVIEEFQLRKAEAIVYADGKEYEVINLMEEMNKEKPDSDNQMLNYTRTMDLKDLIGKEIEVIVTVEDKMGNKNGIKVNQEEVIETEE